MSVIIKSSNVHGHRLFYLGSVDVSFTAAFGPVLGLNKEEMATWYTYHERFLTFVPPQKWAKPEGLSRKMAIHCVMLLDNNPLLSSSHALCLAIFRLSAMANETSTDPSSLSDLDGRSEKVHGRDQILPDLQRQNELLVKNLVKYRPIR